MMPPFFLLLQSYVKSTPLFSDPDFRYSETEMRNNFETPPGWQEAALTSELQ